MFATCLFCHSSLGTNESIEHFPIGRRLAFDAAKGRLWVVCSKCERWNLSPLDERWEAIEEAERAYRDTKKRVTTDNIGLARLSDGTDLVRIGAPLRPEFAAWRYGDQFGRRRRKRWMLGAGGVAAMGAVAAGGAALGLAVLGSIAYSAMNVGFSTYVWLVPRARVRDVHGRLMALSALDLRSARVALQGEANTLRVELDYHELVPSGRILGAFGCADKADMMSVHKATLQGDVAARALVAVIAALNGYGASNRQVQSAVDVIESHDNSMHSLLRNAITVPSSKQRSYFAVDPLGAGRSVRQDGTRLLRDASRPLRLRTFANVGHLSEMPTSYRLAIEMALQEDDERRALSGELQLLEQRWKDAEGIAAIADSLLLPVGMNDQIARLHGEGETSSDASSRQAIDTADCDNK